MKTAAISNEEIADTLDHVADLLELENESGFRVQSYRNAAQTLRDLDAPVNELLKQDGEHLLKDLPGIGDKLAGSIREIATTGRLGLAERLERETWPGQLFTEVPGPGARMSRVLRGIEPPQGNRETDFLQEYRPNVHSAKLHFRISVL